MSSSQAIEFGWVDRPKDVDSFVASLRYPVFGQACRAFGIQDSGEGKVVLLHKAVERVVGHVPIHNQKIGDCVSHGFGSGVDFLTCVEIDMHGESEEWQGETVTETIYGSSRVEIGGGQLGNGDGSLGAWGAKAVKEYGTLLRKKYGGWDFTNYSGNMAKTLGRKGMPDELEPTAREHRVRTVSLVQSYEEARDAICNGYPVPVCSMQGFKSRRDNDGFARPEGQWAHCMLFCGADDKSGRPGLLCLNSWGSDWIQGPKRHDQPDGSFWVDAQTCTKMLRSGDSYALSGYEGYPAQETDIDHLYI
jgi:hypothetical protein